MSAPFVHRPMSAQESVFTHVALPPQLPQRADVKVDGIEAALVDYVSQAARCMRDTQSGKPAEVWDAIRRCLTRCRILNMGGVVEKTKLISTLQELQSGDFLALRIGPQNAGVFIRLPTEQFDDRWAIFEFLETSPKRENVIRSETGTLTWAFPGSAIAIPRTTFEDDEFTNTLAGFLEQASTESAEQVGETIKKASSKVLEKRETPDPSLVTALLAAILEANGQRLQVTLLEKKIRDDVCWHNAAGPWRRLPYWLVLRVVIERHLLLMFDKQPLLGRLHYKFFQCVLHCLVLEGTYQDVSSENQAHLKSKLCRRLFKLDRESSDWPAPEQAAYKSLTKSLEDVIGHRINNADHRILSTWQSDVSSLVKPIQLLPKRAERHHMRLQLNISRPAIVAAQERFQNSEHNLRHTTAKPSSAAEGGGLRKLASLHMSLFRKEDDLQSLCTSIQNNSGSGTSSSLHTKILDLIDAVDSSSDADVELKSSMLLTVFEAWTCLDRIACLSIPLLRQYHPGFSPHMLEVLNLPRFSDMLRAREIQSYLQCRIEAARSTETIFEDPHNGCFAERYFNECDQDGTLGSLLQQIRAEAEIAKKAKEAQWRELTARYDDLTKKYEAGTCLYVDNGRTGPKHEAWQCPRCQTNKTRSRMEIRAFEEPLPQNDVQAKAVTFELIAPRDLVAYRDATWAVWYRLGVEKREAGITPRVHLQDYSELKRYMTAGSGDVTLASTAKSFLMTHYATLSFPVSLDQVIRPNALKYGYYTVSTRSWPGRLNLRPKLTQHCRIPIPSSSPYAEWMSKKSFSPEGTGPSSYEIIANHTSCPTNLNAQEFMAFQSMLSGKPIRWITILIELASPNLNMSAADSVLLLKHLSAQLGPVDQVADEGAGVIHSVFKDPVFCQVLLRQLRQRLADIKDNWREVYLMEVTITLALRISDIAAQYPASRDWVVNALQLVEQCREATLRWMRELRTAGYNVTDIEAIKQNQCYTLWAALLCKRTFAVLLAAMGPDLDSDDLAILIECCATAHDSTPDRIQDLPIVLQQSFLSDLKLQHRLKRQVLQAMMQFGKESLLSALQQIWPAADSVSDFETSYRDGHWIAANLLSQSHRNPQPVEYNYLYGTLLVDGEPMTRLAPEPQNEAILTELFGVQNLRKYPSRLPGMTHALTIQRGRYTTHIGYTNGRMIIRAVNGNQILELIPRGCFHKDNLFDLPAELVDDCFHWLDLRTGIIEIRPRKYTWYPHASHWKLDTRDSTCYRVKGRGPNESKDMLVDPYSPLFLRVARLFDYFEPRRYLTIFQPANYSVTVDMKRMQLRWFVNSDSALQSRQLSVQIDPNQDMGTWYGFRSALVCRNIDNPDERTVLVPFLPLRTMRHRSHVWVDVVKSFNPTINYLRFTINAVLGRLDCAAEPVLVFKKAEIHALTSSLLADPLTRRTGAEEALNILSSGLAQPWTPLAKGPTEILHAIARICPERQYYPEDKRDMQKSTWRFDLPCHAQREEYPILVDRILQRSARLSTFRPDDAVSPAEISSTNPQLNVRALRRRDKHRRRIEIGLKLNDGQDGQYVPRDRLHNHRRYERVLETTTLLRQCPGSMPTCNNLAQLLSEVLVITGFNEAFDKPTISDKLDVNLRANWGQLVKAVRNMDGFRLMFFIGTVAFGKHNDRNLLRTLVAFCIFEQLKTLPLPTSPVFSNFRPHQTPQFAVLMKLVEPHKVPAPEDPDLAEFATGKQKKNFRLAREAHEKKSVEDCEFFVRNLLNQWPCAEPHLQFPTRTFLIDIEAAHATVRQEWNQLYMNRELSLHLDSVQSILNKQSSGRAFECPAFVASDLEFPRSTIIHELPLLSEVLAAQDTTLLSTWESDAITGPAPFVSTQDAQFDSGDVGGKTDDTRDAPWVPRVDGELFRIIKTFSASASLVRQKYAADLLRSFDAFVNSRPESNVPSHETSTQTPVYFKLRVAKLLETFSISISAPSHRFTEWQIQWLRHGQLWPAVTPVTLLEQLRSSREPNICGAAKGQIIKFGLSITDYQRASRMQKYEMAGESNRWQEEQANPGHRKWDPAEHPDWLLLEIESDILIRDNQFEVAQAIIAPESGKCSVLQLNMGQGKTSCIIPMVATTLADGDNLVRVCVPKALLQQTAQLLQTRLGGLVGRRIGHVPFSRRTPTDESTIKQFQRLHIGLQKDRGVMMCLPEHQLSFSLSTSQRILDDRVPEANLMMRVQNWLRSHARDILDESDHTLAVRTQLIYPSGGQTAVDGRPHRWLVAEQVLALVELQLDELQRHFPQSIEVVRREAGGFPYVFFLRNDVEEELILRLTWDICHGHRGILPIESLNSQDRLAIKEFLTASTIRRCTLDRINSLCPDQAHIRSSVYMLRGLLVHRILLTTLKKRYGVTYGLHELREPVAVPFHAKGVPSDTSEFGHVDVSIMLTCLAFYHMGLNSDQLREALSSVLKSDDPAAEYENWCDHEMFPEHLRNWHSINAGDEQQIADIHRCVQYKVVVIDYYLNNFVFPKHAKQFKVKLQSSGWDIPLFSTESNANAENATGSKSGRHLTTGFSGTNDIKPLLPLTISQDDIPSLLKTNAEVLTYLLQPRSRNYEVMKHKSGKRMTESEFLYMLKCYSRGRIRILIDSGAQILEMTNAELAQKWLSIDGSASAALYFEGDRPFIMSKTGAVAPLSSSPYANNLKEVLVYLDEAHTRGTDLPFDRDARAALTLGLGQTKDHTVQAAMRMRQLGTTQSVTFFAPVEVDQSIRDLCEKKAYEKIYAGDVIKWLLHNTCNLTESLQPLYYAQGVDFCRRMQAAADYPNLLKNAADRKEYIRVIRQTERQTLQQLYAPQSKNKLKDKITFTGTMAEFHEELNQRKEQFQDTGHAVHASVLEEVEQEREIEQEVEAVRQVKKPLPCTPYTFPGLHRDIETFAKSGRFAAGSDVFVPSFAFMARTSTGKEYKINQKAGSAKLFVTTEFARSVRVEVVLTNDNFIRPVQWILYSPEPEAAVVVTPEEAGCLIPFLRAQTTTKSQSLPAAYLLTYSGPITRRMRHTLGSFKFYSIPTLPEDWVAPIWMKIEVGLLAGRLYFDWDEYPEICKFLGGDDAGNFQDEVEEVPETGTSEQESGDITSQSDSNLGKFSSIMSFDGAADENFDNDAVHHSAGKNATRAMSRKKPSSAVVALSTKPFSFTKDWLSVRRRGQEFSHSPMGFLCLRKPLHEDHVFFSKGDRISARHNKDSDHATDMPIGMPQFDGAHDYNDEDEAAAAATVGAVTDEIDYGDHDAAAALRDDDVDVQIEYDSDDMFAPMSDQEEEEDYEEYEGVYVGGGVAGGHQKAGSSTAGNNKNNRGNGRRGHNSNRSSGYSRGSRYN